MAVANKLRDIRESYGVIQKDLAKAIGFSEKTISRVEREETSPSEEFMLHMATYFNLLVEDIFTIRD